MKATIRRDVLTEALRRVAPVAGKRGTHMVYEGVLVRAQPGALTFGATDLEQEIQLGRGAQVESEGVTLVNARALQDAVRTCRGDQVALLLDEGARLLTVSSGITIHKLPTLSPADFPAAVEPDGPRITLSAADLAQALALTAFACSTERMRFALNAQRWLVRDGQLDIAASDGRRFARVACPVGGEFDQLLVPRTLVQLVRSMLSASSCERVRITSGRTHVTFEFDPDRTHVERLSGRRAEGTFPDVDGDAASLLARPAEALSWETKRSALSSALATVAVVHDKEHRRATLNFLKGSLNVSASREGQRVEDEAAFTASCEAAASVQLNTTMLREAVEACPTETVRLELHPLPDTNERPIHVLPVRADGETHWSDAWRVAQMPMYAGGAK